MAHSPRKQPVQSSPRIAGYFRGIPIEVRNDVPDGTIFVINEEYLKQQFYAITNIKTRKWRSKIYNTLRAFFRRKPRDKR